MISIKGYNNSRSITHTAHSVARGLQEGSMGVAVECCLGANTGTFLEHFQPCSGGNIAHLEPSCQSHGTFRTFSGNGHGAFRTFSGNGHGVFRTFSGNGHGTFRTFSGNGHGAFRAFSGNGQGTFRIFSDNGHGAFWTFSGNGQATFRTFYNKGSRIDSYIDFSLIDINNNYCWCRLLYMYIFFYKILMEKGETFIHTIDLLNKSATHFLH